MILTYRQRLIIANLINAKIHEIEGVNLTLNNDCEVLKEFSNKLLECNEVTFCNETRNIN